MFRSQWRVWNEAWGLRLDLVSWFILKISFSRLFLWISRLLSRCWTVSSKWKLQGRFILLFYHGRASSRKNSNTPRVSLIPHVVSQPLSVLYYRFWPSPFRPASMTSYKTPWFYPETFSWRLAHLLILCWLSKVHAVPLIRKLIYLDGEELAAEETAIFPPFLVLIRCSERTSLLNHHFKNAETTFYTWYSSTIAIDINKHSMRVSSIFLRNIVMK